jgi:hypothetical protein
MHYVQYIPGTIAHITDHPTRHGDEDVNALSRLVAKFNDTIKLSPSMSKHRKIQFFVELFKPFQL